MTNSPSPWILGLAALIAAGGCGSGSGRPTVPPPDAPSVRGPSPMEPGVGPPDPPMDVKLASRPIPWRRRPLRAPAIATGDPELDPLVSYLKASFSDPIKDGRRLVIVLTTEKELAEPRQTYQNFLDELLKQATEQVPAEMIRDFGEKNRGLGVIWAELSTHLPAKLPTPVEIEAIFARSPSDSPHDGWGRFYKKHPDAYAMIGVSRVGLNRDKTLALFYLDVSQGLFSAYGQFHILKKEGSEWVELPISIGSSWTA